MLSPLGRNGLHHRSVIDSRPSNRVLFSFICRHHQFFRHRRHAHMFRPTHSTLISHPPTSSSVTLPLYRRITNSPQDFLLTARFFSTPPTTTSKSKDASDAHTIASPVKAKVELRPGPIKPPITPSSAHLPKAKKPLATNPLPQPQSTPTSPTSTPPNAIAETMKEDLKQAYIHGVLARPPPNAGKIATLWHKAKELFVREPFESNVNTQSFPIQEILLSGSQVSCHTLQTGQRASSSGEGWRGTSVSLGSTIYSNKQE